MRASTEKLGEGRTGAGGGAEDGPHPHSLKACPPPRLYLSSGQMPSKKAKPPKEPTERVFLIDSFSHIFRAFFAPMGARTEPLTNSRGQVTQAVFVFTNLIRTLPADENPH